MRALYYFGGAEDVETPAGSSMTTSKKDVSTYKLSQISIEGRKRAHARNLKRDHRGSFGTL